MHTHPFQHVLGRRGFLGNVFSGLAGVGIASLLGRESHAAFPGWRPEAGITHFPAQGEAGAGTSCPGAASQVDLWDYKPELFKLSASRCRGKKTSRRFRGKTATSPWGVRSLAGRSGKMISSLLPHMAKHIDPSPSCIR